MSAILLDMHQSDAIVIYFRYSNEPFHWLHSVVPIETEIENPHRYEGRGDMRILGGNE